MWSRRTVISAAAGVLALTGASAGFASPGATASVMHDPLARVSGPSPFQADCNGPVPLAAPYVNAEVEPYVAVNPRNPANLIGVYQEDRYPNDGANGVLASVSLNGGLSWAVPPLARQPRFSNCAGGSAANGGNFEKTTDPWVAFSPAGLAYVVAVSYNDSNAATAELVATSANGGRSWGQQRSLIRDDNPNVIDDRPAVTTDPARPLTAYVVWARQVTGPPAAARGAVYFSRTTDGGATWSAARAIYQTPLGMQTSANQIVVLPDGDLLDVFNQLGQGKDFDHPRHDTITVIRSSDRGLTWSGPTTLATNFVNGVTDPHTGQPVRDGDDFTEIAVDPRPGTSNVYAVWGDARFTNGGPQQIAFTRSADGGRTWSQPIRVSANIKTQAFVPAVAVDGHGDLAVAYYDFSADRPASQFLATQYWITFSANQGRTWSARQQVTSQPFDLRTAPFQTHGGFFLGEYQGLAGAGQRFVVAATFTNGHSLDNRTDIYSATFVAPSR